MYTVWKIQHYEGIHNFLNDHRYFVLSYDQLTGAPLIGRNMVMWHSPMCVEWYLQTFSKSNIQKSKSLSPKDRLQLNK